MPSIAQRLRRRLSRLPRGAGGRGGYKMVDDRVKAARTLTGSIETFKHSVAATLGERQAPFLRAGETLPDYTLSLELAVREVRAAAERLKQADVAYRGALMRHVIAQRERREWVRGELYPRVRDVRQSINLILGQELGPTVHCLQGRTRRKIEPLETQARGLVAQLKSMSGKALPRVDGGTVDPRMWLGDVQPAYDRLQELHREVWQREQETSPPLQEKEWAMEAFDVTYKNALAYARSLYAHAGRPDRTLRDLLADFQRRRLARWAQWRRHDRARGKRPAAGQGKRERWSPVASVSAWLRGRRPSGRRPS